MRRLVVQAFCGVEWSEDRREVEAVFSDTVTVGAVTRNLDLCEAHVRVDLRTLATYLQRYGTKVVDAATADEPKRKRERKVASVLPKDGVLVLEDGRRRCLEPGCQRDEAGMPYTTKLGAKNPGAAMGIHRRTAHGIVGQSPASIRERRLKEESLP